MSKKFRRIVAVLLCAVVVLLMCDVEAFSASKKGKRKKVHNREAQTENAETQFQRGLSYQRQENYTEAVKWYRKAAERGHAKAQNNLGCMYEGGYGVKQDDAEAVRWFRKAAEQGHGVAQNNLGTHYIDGHGVKQDYLEAVYWIHKAAEQGVAVAQNDLGYMYFNGFGVKQDYAETEKWCRKAAEQGHAGAQNQLESLKQILASQNNNTSGQNYSANDYSANDYSYNEPPVITKVLPSGRVVRYTPSRNSAASNSPETCSACTGSGKCPSCDGMGFNYIGYKGNGDTMLCLSCSGTGKCGFCEGTGYRAY